MAGAIIRHACKPSTHWILKCCQELNDSSGRVLLSVFTVRPCRTRLLNVLTERSYWTSVTLPFTNVTFKSLYT
jgi:hypothetical protein